MKDYFVEEIGNTVQDYYSKEVENQPRFSLGNAGLLALKGIADIIPGAAYAGQFYQSGGNIAQANKAIAPYEALQPRGIMEQIAYGAPKMLGRLPFYAGAAQLMGGVNPNLISRIGSFSGLSGLEQVMQGQPQEAGKAMLESVPQYLAMAAGSKLGRLTPQNAPWLARPLSAIGGAIPFSAFAPKGEKVSSAILGGGLGAIYPERPLSPIELQAAKLRTQGSIEQQARVNLQKLGQLGQNVWDVVTKFGPRISPEANQVVREYGTDETFNDKYSLNRARPLLNKSVEDIFNGIQQNKTKIGQQIGDYREQLKNSIFEPTPVLDILAQGLQEGNVLSPEQIQDYIYGKSARDRILAKAKEQGGIIANKADLEKVLRKNKQLSIFDVNELTEPLPAYLKKTVDRISTAVDISSIQRAMDLIGQRASKGTITPAEQRALWNTYYSLRDMVTQQVGANLGDAQAQKYSSLTQQYSDILNKEGAIEGNLNPDPKSKSYWRYYDNAGKFGDKLFNLVNMQDLGGFIKQIAPGSFDNIRKFAANQEFLGASPSMFRGRALNIFLTLLGFSMGGPTGGAVALGGTLAPTYRTIWKTYNALKPTIQQLTTLRPNALQVKRALYPIKEYKDMQRTLNTIGQETNLVKIIDDSPDWNSFITYFTEGKPNMIGNEGIANLKALFDARKSGLFR